MNLRVNEIFCSIQGESTFAGRPCIFIRLSGCNLRCSYCDTRYAHDEGKVTTIERILDHIASFRCTLVEITGGEPLLQKATPCLAGKLLDAGYEVLLETNGTLSIDRIDIKCVRIVDVKCPSSGEAEKNDPENLNRLTARDELKFVIGCREDYEYARRIITSPEVAGRHLKPSLLSPVFKQLEPKRLASWILEDRLDVRLQLPIHKILWGDRRGV